MTRSGTAGRLDRERLATIALFLLRVVAALLFFQAGARKLFGWYGGPPDGHELALFSQKGVGAVMEVVGGVALMLGAWTRPVAFIASGEMAVAYWQFHFPKGTWPIQNGGIPAVLLCFVFLYIAAAGGGAFSVDGWRNRREAR